MFRLAAVRVPLLPSDPKTPHQSTKIPNFLPRPIDTYLNTLNCYLEPFKLISGCAAAW